MSRNRIELPVSPERVFEVLLDPYSYPRWVVGAQRIRSVDPEWPAPGSKFHHSVGVGPARLSDSSKLVDLDPPHRLRLEVRFRPIGVADVVFAVEPLDPGCVVTMIEEPKGGPFWKFWNGLIDLAVQGRNEITLHRLRRETQRRDWLIG